MSKFEYAGHQFYLNGDPITIISGTIHYFRTFPEQWEDRLLKLKACGFNTVETYVPWNLHEKKEGVFDFEGMLDIIQFIKLAQSLDLLVIIRPGPYICAEWDFGGLPPWLLNCSDIKLRCFDPIFLDKVDNYFDILMGKLRPYLCTNGGPIIAMQVENEYGSYGNDKKYLEYLRKGLITRGIDILLFTSDGPTDLMLQGGTLEGVLKTANFGSNPREAFSKLREYENGPLMCMEFWIGWFDAWGKNKVIRNGKEVANDLKQMLEMNAHVNFYMFHGGTNFGLMNGANWSDKEGFKPQATSYDYDALLTEAGDTTKKYYEVREVLQEYVNIDKKIPIANSKKKNYGQVTLNKYINLMKSPQLLSNVIKSQYPLSFEELEHYYGFVLYRSIIKNKMGKVKLTLNQCNDRAVIYLDRKYQGTIDKTKEEKYIYLDVKDNHMQLDILVENMGRTNYGPYMGESKGITKGVLLDYQYQSEWEMYKVDVDNVVNMTFDDEIKCQAGFYKGFFEVDEVADTFVLMEGWKKGIVIVNGFNLGRYWDIGPQKTLYLPWPLLKKGLNEIIVFDMHGNKNPNINLVDYPVV